MNSRLHLHIAESKENDTAGEILMVDDVQLRLMLKQLTERVEHTMTMWLIVGGVTLIGIGFVFEFLGDPQSAAFLGTYGVAMFLFAIALYGSLLSLKYTAPIFMDQDSGSAKKTE